jgi:hypothetical protein
MRAKLERSCPALDYYFGFYIMPAADGQICADRDSIRSRVGGECGIDRFRTLKAAGAGLTFAQAFVQAQLSPSPEHP